MDRFDDDTLLTELRAVRPEPRPEFTAELDERAAAGFPRREPRDDAGPIASLLAHLQSMTPRRRLIPVFGVLLAALAVATAIIATNGGGKAENLAMTSENSKLSEVAPAESGTAVEEEAGGVSEESEESAGSTSSSVEPVFETGLPEVEHNVSKSAKPAPNDRNIERSASIVLGAKSDEVSAAAAKVFAAVHTADGIVLHSSVQSGSHGATGASFDLLIPSRKLDDALASFSQIAEVRSRHDGTNDITAPTVGAAERLADSNAAIQGLLKELADTETEVERESVEARLREERRHHAALRASLDRLHERASMSEVSVRIVTGNGAGAVPAGKGSGGGWDVGDALHDAGHILTIAAGVVLIALAVMAPFALIAAAIWLANRFRIRILRERTLD